MAGNLVKWWKHKILGGYKQFSVQECTTDSEELMYHQVRASSSCSAPPDLLLVSDRENNIPLRSPVVNIIGATTSATAPATLTTTSPSSGINACPITSVTNNNQRHHQKLLQHQQQQQHHHHVTTQQLSLAYNNGTKDVNGRHQKNITGFNSSSTKHNQQQLQQQQQQQDLLQHQHTPENEGHQQQQHQQVETQTTTNNHSSTQRHAHHSQHHQQQQQQQQQRNEEQHIRLEEFTCDVSVEGGKSSQPLQFSFTFYDLDGHHGKITKDDIVGIVYTIYESIGKSVVVPHSGSKTINVRLTVSPEGKSKSAKTKKTQASAVILDNSHTHSNQKGSAANTTQQATRRLHRYRPRKLIKSDEEDDDSNSDKEQREANLIAANLSNILPAKSSAKSHKTNIKLNKEQQQQCCSAATQPLSAAELPNSPLESIYDNIKPASAPDACRECMAAVDETRIAATTAAAVSPTTASTQFHHSKSHTTNNTPNEAYMKHVASTRIKMLRKSRKQKHQDCIETRQRSLSVGNETCWKNRHLQKQPTQQQLQWHAAAAVEQQQLQTATTLTATTDTVDGVQLRNPLKAAKVAMSQKRSSAECWKTALNRNDLISIIRESMEKNRLCFQLNGKPQANVSPIRHSQQQQHPQQQQQHHLAQHQHKHSQQPHPHSTQPQRQRSNTVSKIPTLIANHNNVHSVSPQSHSVHRSSSCTNNNNSNNNNDTSLHDHQNNTTHTSSNSIYHPQPHIPIYHQQMAINPAVIAAQNALTIPNSAGGALAGHHHKMNLCGYDSFLHATICGGGLSHSPPPPPTSALNNLPTSGVAGSPLSPANGQNYGHYNQQQIATVQPIMSAGSTNPQTTPKHMGLAVSSNNQIKTSKILRSGSYAQAHQKSLSAANSASPQYHGYQRLSSASKHNLAALHLVSPTMEKPQIDQLDKWRRDQVKNYDQLLYAKLSEKLQQTNLVTPSRENRDKDGQRRKHRMLRQRRSNAYVQEANNISLPTVLTNKLCVREGDDDGAEYATMMPINVDPVECENLIGQTSDEESHSQHEQQQLIISKEQHNESAQARHVVEGTLVDLDDVHCDQQQQELESNIKHHSLNVDSLLQAVQADEDHDMHLVDDLEIDEDLVGDLDDLEEVVSGAGVGLTETGGRQSAASNDTNAGCANLAHTNAANTSTTSSLIHRYVHEHIHHHYHHFEEKEE